VDPASLRVRTPPAQARGPMRLRPPPARCARLRRWPDGLRSP